MAVSIAVMDEAQQVLESISAADIHRTQFWLDSLAEDWRGEIPMRIHSAGVFGLGSAPPFSGEFIGYIGDLECGQPDCKEGCHSRNRGNGISRNRNGESRLRATKAFRHVRRVAPREFDALYMYCVNRFTIAEIAKTLTERAIRLDKPERYSRAAVTLLLISGTDKVTKAW